MVQDNNNNNPIYKAPKALASEALKDRATYTIADKSKFVWSIERRQYQ